MDSLVLGEIFDPSKSTESQYIDAIYGTFLADLADSNLHWKCPSMRVSFRRHPEVDGRHAIFWHIVSGGGIPELDRTLEPQRCARIGWIKPMILQFNIDFPEENELMWWVSQDPRWHGRRYGLATCGYDYVVFIEERESYALLVTAYYVEQSRRREKFRKEHDLYWEKQGPLV